MSVRSTTAVRAWSLLPGLLLCVTLTSATHAADTFSANALAGVGRVQVEVEGVANDFARYGLTPDELRRRVEARLAAYGLPVVDAAGARSHADAAQLLVKLTTNRDQYSMYFYAISLRLKRKVPLDASGTSFAAQEVWSEGQHGILNPSDLKAIYGYVDTLLDAFITAHGRDNAGRPLAGS
ncbi:MAG: hypothetical protein H6977_14360 [Gammaproteobacteria bacterium]|nr:hypothetical protein [Gammaproteobacteria bacterium]MCP5201192.1 hypothetical protein [Gammaproteobacteria bacterium]